MATVTIPAQTITLPATPVALPAGMTFDGTTLTVPQIKLTAGPTYADGMYLVTMKGGVETLTPVTLVALPSGGHLVVAP